MPFSEELKKQVRAKCYHACCLCKKLGVEIHHIIPQHENGLDNIENAIPLCPSCHEIYGDNPRKRKMLKEARELWYEICEKRYQSDNNILQDIRESLEYFRKNYDISILKNEIANAIIEKLTKQNFIKSNIEYKLPLNAVIERILQFEKILTYSNSESIVTTYCLLYETEGDKKHEFDVEYNEMRDLFLLQFGKIVAKNITHYIVSELKIDWLKGVPEPVLNKAINLNFFTMTVLLMHEDLTIFKEKVSLGFIGQNELIAKLEFTGDDNINLKDKT